MKSFQSMINDSLSALSVLLSGTGEEAQENENFDKKVEENQIDGSVFYDCEEKEKNKEKSLDEKQNVPNEKQNVPNEEQNIAEEPKPQQNIDGSVLFDDSASFSQEINILDKNLENDLDLEQLEKSKIKELETKLREKEYENKKMSQTISLLKEEISRMETNCTEKSFDKSKNEEDLAQSFNNSMKLNQNSKDLPNNFMNQNEKEFMSNFNNNLMNNSITNLVNKSSTNITNLEEQSKANLDDNSLANNSVNDPKNNSNLWNTNHLLNTINLKEKEIHNLNNKIEKMHSNTNNLEQSLIVLEKDLNRTNESKEALSFLFGEKIESYKNIIESLRDQLEFERSKNYKIKNDLNETRKKCIEMVEAVEILIYD